MNISRLLLAAIPVTLIILCVNLIYVIIISSCLFLNVILKIVPTIYISNNFCICFKEIDTISRNILKIQLGRNVCPALIGLDS